jgi:hypothetical protein
MGVRGVGLLRLDNATILQDLGLQGARRPLLPDCRRDDVYARDAVA